MSPESQIISQNISMLLTQGRSAEARLELERLLSLNPEDPEARSLAGDVFSFTGASSAAYKHYNAAAETYNRLGRADMALAVHHKILELDLSQLDAPTQARVRLLQLLVFAEDAIVSGQNEKAVAGFTDAIRQFPNHTITYQRLANLLVRMGRVDEAQGHYLTVAEAFFAHGVFPKARPYFERVLELKPSHSVALEKLLACLSAEGREAEGQRFVKAGVLALLKEGDSNLAAALHVRLPKDQQGPSALSAALLLQTGHLEAATQMASTLETARPELAEWFRGLARAAQDRADVGMAEAYGRWAQGDFNPPQAPVEPKPEEMAPVLRPESAPVEEAPLEPAGVPAPEDRMVLQTMGEMCLAEEMFEEAKQVFERLLSADPHHQGYWEDLNRARAGLGLPPQFPGANAPQTVLAPPRPPVPPVPPAAVLAVDPEAKITPPPPPTPPPVAEIPVPKAAPAIPPPPVPAIEPVVVAAPVVVTPEAVAPPALPPLPALVVAAPKPQPVPVAEIPAPPVAPPALPPAEPEAPPVLPPLPLVAQRPELEPMGRHGSATAKPTLSSTQRPAVEWADAPYAVGPGGEAKAKPTIKVPAALVPPKPLANTLTPPPPLAALRILRHQFVTVLGELPPAVSSEVDDSDELIA